jgi:hypothetical protein
LLCDKTQGVKRILVVILVSVGIVWLKRESSPRIIDIFVDSLETIAIASAGVVSFLKSLIARDEIIMKHGSHQLG